jgi:hypothetical protein
MGPVRGMVRHFPWAVAEGAMAPGEPLIPVKPVGVAARQANPAPVDGLGSPVGARTRIPGPAPGGAYRPPRRTAERAVPAPAGAARAGPRGPGAGQAVRRIQTVTPNSSDATL